MDHSFHKSITQHNCIQFIIRNVSWAPNQHVKMISEGLLYMTMKTGVMAALPSQEKLHKINQNRKHLHSNHFLQYYFFHYCILDEILKTYNYTYTMEDMQCNVCPLILTVEEADVCHAFSFSRSLISLTRRN